MDRVGGIAANVPNCLVNSIRGQLIFTALQEIIWLEKIYKHHKNFRFTLLDLN